LHRYLESEGLPVFDTEEARTPGEVAACLERLRSRGFRSAAVKSQIGASGVGIARVATDGGGVVAVPGSFFYEGECMVQGWIEAGLHGVGEVTSPSVQMFVGDERVYLYDLTEQILSHESVHEGNVSPPAYLGEREGLAEELYRQAGIAGEWLHGQGYRGTASVDFLVAPVDGRALGEGVYVCEVNARITGATYPSVLARHFVPGGAWLMRNLKFDVEESGERLLEMLADHGHLFVKGGARGVLPINFNTSPGGRVGKGQFLCLGETPEECGELLLQAEREMPVDWNYVRD
ncbi:MAG: hypothetical protein P8J87_21505, partial [Verrucomicrobiales bacterium]|nr:hypothetical protein [Verrucomicrobiales bacterium]